MPSLHIAVNSINLVFLSKRLSLQLLKQILKSNINPRLQVVSASSFNVTTSSVVPCPRHHTNIELVDLTLVFVFVFFLLGVLVVFEGYTAAPVGNVPFAVARLVVES